jgi:hypothetical protein
VGNEAGKRHNTSLYRRTLRRASVGQDRASTISRISTERSRQAVPRAVPRSSTNCESY